MKYTDCRRPEMVQLSGEKRGPTVDPVFAALPAGGRAEEVSDIRMWDAVATRRCRWEGVLYRFLFCFFLVFGSVAKCHLLRAVLGNGIVVESALLRFSSTAVIFVLHIPWLFAS